MRALEIYYVRPTFALGQFNAFFLTLQFSCRHTLTYEPHVVIVPSVHVKQPMWPRFSLSLALAQFFVSFVFCFNVLQSNVLEPVRSNVMWSRDPFNFSACVCVSERALLCVVNETYMVSPATLFSCCWCFSVVLFYFVHFNIVIRFCLFASRARQSQEIGFFAVVSFYFYFI